MLVSLACHSGHPCAPFGISTPSLQCHCSLHLRILQLEKHKSMFKKMLLINYRLPLPNSVLLCIIGDYVEKSAVKILMSVLL